MKKPSKSGTIKISRRKIPAFCHKHRPEIRFNYGDYTVTISGDADRSIILGKQHSLDYLQQNPNFHPILVLERRLASITGLAEIATIVGEKAKNEAAPLLRTWTLLMRQPTAAEVPRID